MAGLPYADVLNAAFYRAHPLGARYAGFELATLQAEVVFHKSVQLAEIERFEESVTYDDYFADFSASFHDLRRGRGFAGYLNPRGYVQWQGLAEQASRGRVARSCLPERQARGRHLCRMLPAGAGRECPPGSHFCFTWDGNTEPTVRVES